MFDFSEISIYSDLFGENSKTFCNNKNNPHPDSNNEESDISFILLPENKLLGIEINFKENLESNYLIEQNRNKDLGKEEKKIKFILNKLNIENLEKKENNNNYFKYRKDAYYKHFKSIFSRYIKNKANKLKNICFPHYNNNNFSALSYEYSGNPKEKDNVIFLSFKIKELLIYGKNAKIKNRQYNNELIIKYIEKNEAKSKDKYIYSQLISFLNDSVENELIKFYKNKEEFQSINKDSKCLFYDQYFKKETGMSLLENNGYIKILKNNYK